MSCDEISLKVIQIFIYLFTAFYYWVLCSLLTSIWQVPYWQIVLMKPDDIHNFTCPFSCLLTMELENICWMSCSLLSWVDLVLACPAVWLGMTSGPPCTRGVGLYRYTTFERTARPKRSGMKTISLIHTTLGHGIEK